MKMKISRVKIHKSFFPALFTIIFLLIVPITNAQETVSNQNAKRAVTSATTGNNTARAANTPSAAVPIFTDYKSIRIGMSADEVRDKLDHLKEKGKLQDVFVFSEAESAEVYYDPQGKVTAISVNYIGDDSSAPKPEAVLGEEIQAKPDGSMYELKRYPAAGYWVAYSRIAGKNPFITVTMQKMQ